MRNPRWVCLTSAVVADGKIVIDYRGDGAAFAPHGVHLHIYGGDGTNPPARVMGRQVPESEQGEWYNEARHPAVLALTDERYRSAIGAAKKVCARIADARHVLVPDRKGTYATGNCVPIARTESTTTMTIAPEQPHNGDNAPNPPLPASTTTVPTTSTTETTTTEPTTEESTEPVPTT